MSAGTNASIQAEATSGRISAVPHTSVCGQKSQPGRRKPGGQPGNSNALKHGFYTKNYSLAERRGLQAAEGVVLGDEIGLLRVLIGRFAEQIQASQDVALNESAQHLAVISEAMLRLASLLRTDHMLGGAESSTFITQLSLAIKEITEEMALDAG
jgi:hypothetical protein